MPNGPGHHRERPDITANAPGITANDAWYHRKRCPGITADDAGYYWSPWISTQNNSPGS